jgi:hypothetical protein
MLQRSSSGRRFSSGRRVNAFCRAADILGRVQQSKKSQMCWRVGIRGVQMSSIAKYESMCSVGHQDSVFMFDLQSKKYPSDSAVVFVIFLFKTMW